MEKTRITGLDFINDYIIYPDFDKEFEAGVFSSIFADININGDIEDFADRLYSAVIGAVIKLFDASNPWYEDLAFEDSFPYIELMDFNPYDVYHNFTRGESEKYTPDIMYRIISGKI